MNSDRETEVDFLLTTGLKGEFYCRKNRRIFMGLIIARSPFRRRYISHSLRSTRHSLSSIKIIRHGYLAYLTHLESWLTISYTYTHTDTRLYSLSRYSYGVRLSAICVLILTPRSIKRTRARSPRELHRLCTLARTKCSATFVA